MRRVLQSGVEVNVSAPLFNNPQKPNNVAAGSWCDINNNEGNLSLLS